MVARSKLARIAKAKARRGESRDSAANESLSPAAIAALLGAPVLAPVNLFSAYIRKSPRTVSRMEPHGLPVIRPGREPLVLVERALAWFEAGKPKPRKQGRPRNIDRGEREGGER